MNSYFKLYHTNVSGKLIILLALCIPFLAGKKVDSLQQVLEKTKADTQKLNILHQLVGESMYSDPDQAIRYAKRELKIAKRIKGENRTRKDHILADAYHNLGVVNYIQSDYRTALQFYMKALVQNKKVIEREDVKEALKKKAQQGLANTMGNIGGVYYHQSNYPKALEYFEKSLKLKKSIGDKRGIATSYNNIGTIYDNQGNYPKALEYYLKGLKMRKEFGNKRELATSYNNVGLVYDSQENYSKALNYYFKALHIDTSMGNKRAASRDYNNIGLIYETQTDSAFIKQGLLPKDRFSKSLKFLFKSLKLKKEIKDKQGIATCYNNIGSLFSKVYEEPDSIRQVILQWYFAERESLPSLAVSAISGSNVLLDLAHNYFRKAYAINKTLNDDHSISLSMQGLGQVLHKKHKYNKAIELFHEAYALADIVGALKTEMKAVYGLYKSYKALDNNQKALYWHEKYVKYKSKLFNKEKHKTIGRLQAKYKWQRKLFKEKQLHKREQALAREQAKRQQWTIYGVSGGLVIVLGLLGLLFNRFRVTRQQKKIIESQKQKVDKAYSELNQTHTQLKKKNDAITDSINYAQRIQSAFLTADRFLDKHFADNYFILFKPKEVVSGDFYWSYQKGNKFYWTVVDCTGHGVPGAFMSMIGNRLLNESIIEKGLHAPDKILNEMRSGIIDTLHQEGEFGEARDGLDMALCVFDLKKGEVQFAGANNSLYIIRDKIALENSQQNTVDRYFGQDLGELRGDKQPVGYVHTQEASFSKKTIPLREGDQFYVFSDGFADQFGGQKGKKFNYNRLKELLLSIRGQSMKKQKQLLDKAIKQWMDENNEEQIDDICVMGLQYT